MGIRLTPAGRLRWESSEDEAVPGGSQSLQHTFESDWREALFTLAADKIPAQDRPSVRYWQQFAERYLTGLCHVPEDARTFEVEPLSCTDCAHWILTAPPMHGGEYLSEGTLLRIWERLDGWVRATVASSGGLAAFLQQRAPKWHQVGRVCFHLAENRNDEAHPFAFMATYASGFGAAGRVKHLPLRKALEQYAGAKNRPALVKLLSPIQQAADVCGWVKDLVDSGDVYRPMAWTAAHAWQLLRSAADLEESGLSVRLPNWWQRRSRPQVSVTLGARAPVTLGTGAMLDFNVRVALGDASLSPEELESLLDGEDGLVLLKGQWVEVDREKLREAIEHWTTLQRQAEGGEISFVEGMRLLAGASVDLRHEERTDDERHWVHVVPGDAMREIIEGLRRPGALDAVEIADALQGTLRPYQHEGLSWLRFLTRLGLGACLADDMGLGKTIQVLALLLGERRGSAERPGAPSLLVVPASLLGNWRDEAARFAPSLKLCFLHPAVTDRRRLADIAAAPEAYLAGTDLVVTTYAMLVRQTWLAEVSWQLVILDEAQAIRNPATRQSRAVRKLTAAARIALTGTPVENRLADLWALFDFLNPGLLGSRTVFQSFVKSLQAREENPYSPLRRLVGPYILRRLKTDREVIGDLPEEDGDGPLLLPDPNPGQALRPGRAEHEAGDGVCRRHRPARRGTALAPAPEAGLQPSQPASRRRRIPARRQRQVSSSGGDLRRACRTSGEDVDFHPVPRGDRSAGRISGDDFRAVRAGAARRDRSRGAPRPRDPVPERRRATILHPVAQGGRHRAESHRRVARRPLRPLVEPGGRESGHRPRFSHRPAPQRSGCTSS